MKYFSFLFFVVFLSACSKEKLYGPFNLKNGQEVELVVDHRYDAMNESLLILPQNQPAEMSLHGFSDRKPGYKYRVKARVNISETPIMDGPDKWFNFTKIISEEKYNGNESFDIALIKSYVPGGPFIALQKKDGKYYYSGGKLELTYTSQEVKNQLEEIWQNFLEITNPSKDTKEPIRPKWTSIKAKVTHDPNNFGKAYLVQHIEFSK